MVHRYALAFVTAAIATPLGGCAYQPDPAFSYYYVPCATAASGTPLAPGAVLPQASGQSVGVTPTSPPAGAPAAAGTPKAPAASSAPSASTALCVVGIPNYDYASGYDPYWAYGWPYDDGFLFFDGFVGDHFRHGFHDHNFHHGFHGRDFHGFRQAGGFRSGGFHGGGHGFGGHGR
jgi:hypothetical protein